MKPTVNLNELEFESYGEGKPGGYAVVSSLIGAKKLGYNVTVFQPGHAAILPFHNHHINEEMFLVLEGEGMLRFGDQTYPLKPMDIIACPPGGREVAHQIRNTGTTDLKFLAVSTKEGADIVEYPDQDTVGAMVGDYGSQRFRAFFKMDSAVGYPCP